MFGVTHLTAPLIFIKSIGIGFFLGLIYGIFTFIRGIIKHKKAAVVAEDIIFFLLAAVITFLFILEVNYGNIRLYIVSGEACGLYLYFTMPVFIVRELSQKAAKKLKRLKK